MLFSQGILRQDLTTVYFICFHHVSSLRKSLIITAFFNFARFIECRLLSSFSNQKL